MGASQSLASAIPRDHGPFEPIDAHVLLVTHASEVFDPEGVIRDGVDRLVRDFRAAGRPVIYLMSDDGKNDATWLAADRSPDLAIDSVSGEHSLSFVTNEVTVAGGYLSLCQSRSVEAAIGSYFNGRSRGRFIVNYPLDGTYEDRYAFVRSATPEARAHLSAIEGPHALRTILDAVGAPLFAEGVSELQVVSGGRYRVHLSVNGRVLKRWGRGSRHVFLNFGE